MRTGDLALEKIKASRFDDREATKLEFLNLFQTFKNFKVNAKKTQHDSLVGYLRLMHKLVVYILEHQFTMYFANFDKKLRKNVVKRCLIQPLTQRIMASSMVKFYRQAN